MFIISVCVDSDELRFGSLSCRGVYVDLKLRGYLRFFCRFVRLFIPYSLFFIFSRSTSSTFCRTVNSSTSNQSWTPTSKATLLERCPTGTWWLYYFTLTSAASASYTLYKMKWNKNPNTGCDAVAVTQLSSSASVWVRTHLRTRMKWLWCPLADKMWIIKTEQGFFLSPLTSPHPNINHVLRCFFFFSSPTAVFPAVVLIHLWYFYVHFDHNSEPVIMITRLNCLLNQRMNSESSVCFVSFSGTWSKSWSGTWTASWMQTIRITYSKCSRWGPCCRCTHRKQTRCDSPAVTSRHGAAVIIHQHRNPSTNTNLFLHIVLPVASNVSHCHS